MERLASGPSLSGRIISRQECPSFGYGTPVGSRRGLRGRRPSKATHKPVTSRMLRREVGGAFLFSSYSLDILFLFSWCFARLIPSGLQECPGGSTDPAPGFDSVSLSPIQTKWRLPTCCCPPPLPGPSRNLRLGTPPCRRELSG